MDPSHARAVDLVPWVDGLSAATADARKTEPSRGVGLLDLGDLDGPGPIRASGNETLRQRLAGDRLPAGG